MVRKLNKILMIAAWGEADSFRLVSAGSSFTLQLQIIRFTTSVHPNLENGHHYEGDTKDLRAEHCESVRNGLMTLKVMQFKTLLEILQLLTIHKSYLGP